MNAADLKPLNSENVICKFADYTYIIIVDSAINTRTHELDNFETWAQKNNLKLNRTKTIELVCVDIRRKRQLSLLPPVPGITRVAFLMILGVAISNHLTVSEHIQHTISPCAQTLDAIKITRAHGMIDTVLQQVYRSVILSKLQYASCAWWDFTKASDRHQIDNFIRQSVKSGFCPADLQSIGGLCETADEKLFNQVVYNPLHVVHQLLPRQSTASQNYNPRPRKHDKELPEKTTHLTDSNFINRLLFSDSY